MFAVHPVAGLPVNYLTARDLLLMQGFAAASRGVYVRMRARGGEVAVLPLLDGHSTTRIVERIHAAS